MSADNLMSDAVMVPREALRQLRRVAEMEAQTDRTASVMIANWIIQDLAASTPVGGWEEPVAWRYRSKSGTSDWMVTQDPNMGEWPNLIVEPLYAAPPPPSVSIDNGSRPQEAVPTCDADGLADKLAKVRDLLRQIWEADSRLVWTGNPPEPSHDEEGECAKLANEAAGLITGIIGQPADGCSSNEGAGGWTIWHGGPNPAPGQIVSAIWNGEEHDDRLSDDLDWDWNDISDPITAYRILPQTEKGS